MDIKDRFIFDSTYGIITPYFKEGIGNTILKDLLKNKYMIDNISERIRLFYVALTRAKKKMIIVTSLDEEKKYVYNAVCTTADNKTTCKYTNQENEETTDIDKNFPETHWCTQNEISSKNQVCPYGYTKFEDGTCKLNGQVIDDMPEGIQ